MTTTNRAPLFVLSALGVMIVVMVLFATAMEAGVGMMILLVICAGVLGAIGLVVFRGVTSTGLAIADKRLQSRAEDYRHIETVLKLGYTPESYEPVKLQIEAHAEPDGGSLQESETEQYRPLALQLVGVTHEKLGSQSKQLIPFNRCAVEKIAPFDDVNAWTNARGWLLNHGFAWKDMRGQKCMGIYFSNGQTVGDVYKRITG
jgi:hypothetical protein